MNERSTVSIAHTNEKHRSLDSVTKIVREALSHLGGMEAFVRSGQTVLIKPNQTVFYSADEGCTTDPLMVGALVRLAYEAGAGHVQVGESSGGFFPSYQCMEITGVKAAAEKEGAEVIDLGSDKTPNRTVPIPKGTLMKECPIPVTLLEADVIIDAPKAKNHHIEPISGALKNWVGTVNQTWRDNHHGHWEMIERFMEIMTVIPPALCVVDALICGEGDGPIADLPRWGGCIIASADPVATDMTICRLLGHDTDKLGFAKTAERLGLGTRSNIDYVGVPLDEVSFEAWPGHKGYDYLPLNFLVGEGVSLPGTIGHVKSALDSMLRRGELREVMWLKGTPTIMIGNIEDPNFEQHLKEGPYLVFDDAARDKYKNDPRVNFIPGHPVLQTALPQLMEGLGVDFLGNAMMKWQQLERWGMHNTEYGTTTHKALTVAKPVAVAALAAAAAVGVTALVKKLTSDHGGSQQDRINE